MEHFIEYKIYNREGKVIANTNFMGALQAAKEGYHVESTVRHIFLTGIKNPPDIENILGGAKT